mgnify:CR=1 FL=1
MKFDSKTDDKPLAKIEEISKSKIDERLSSKSPSINETFTHTEVDVTAAEVEAQESENPFGRNAIHTLTTQTKKEKEKESKMSDLFDSNRQK